MGSTGGLEQAGDGVGCAGVDWAVDGVRRIDEGVERAVVCLEGKSHDA